jgi:cell division protein FtsL
MAARTTRRIHVTRTAPTPKINRWKLFVMMTVAGAIMITGTFFAARQHFLSWDYGMKNSRMRKQIDELETEKRRLLLARENSSSPSEIKRIAKKFGMSDSGAAPTAPAELAMATAPGQQTENTPKLTKTADVKPAAYTVVPASLKLAPPAAKPVVARVAKADRESKRDLAE